MSPTSKFSALLKSIGDRLFTARKKAGLSRRQLAGAAAISERYLAQLETGQANGSLEILFKLASTLDLEWNTLLDFDNAARIKAARLGLAFVGLRGAGKTTLGKELALRRDLAFVQLSRQVEISSGLATEDIFNLGDDAFYRRLEREAIEAIISRGDPIILETTGGIVASDESFEMVRQNFTVVWLTATPEDHMNRVIAQGDMRPITGNDHAMQHLKSLLQSRHEQYALAEHQLCTSRQSVEQCLDKLREIADKLPELRTKV